MTIDCLGKQCDRPSDWREDQIQKGIRVDGANQSDLKKSPKSHSNLAFLLSRSLHDVFDYFHMRPATNMTGGNKPRHPAGASTLPRLKDGATQAFPPMQNAEFSHFLKSMSITQGPVIPKFFMFCLIGQ